MTNDNDDKRAGIKKIVRSDDPTTAEVHMTDGTVETLTGIGEPVKASTIKIGEGTLEDFVNEVVAQAKKEGEIDADATVACVLMNHDTDPTAVLITMSDDVVITVELNRPSH